MNFNSRFDQKSVHSPIKYVIVVIWRVITKIKVYLYQQPSANERNSIHCRSLNWRLLNPFVISHLSNYEKKGYEGDKPSLKINGERITIVLFVVATFFLMSGWVTPCVKQYVSEFCKRYKLRTNDHLNVDYNKISWIICIKLSA